MANSTRTFVAIDLSPKVRDRITRFRRLLEGEIDGVHWVDPGLYHITLAFLGDVAHNDLPTLCKAVAEAAAGHDGFDLHLQGLGVFPTPAKPRVFWMGADGPGVEAITGLQRDVAEAAHRVGYPPDGRFHPHVTLGRLKPKGGGPPGMGALINRHHQWSPGTLAVAKVVTYASTLSAEAPTYATLAVAPLRPRKPETPP